MKTPEEIIRDCHVLRAYTPDIIKRDDRLAYLVSQKEWRALAFHMGAEEPIINLEICGVQVVRR